MVGDNAKRNIGLSICLVLNTGNVRNMLHDILDSIDLENVVNVLHYAGKTLETHTGINILALHFSVVAVSVTVELAEYEIPDLDDIIDLALSLKFLAVELSAAAYSVEVDLTARTART